MSLDPLRFDLTRKVTTTAARTAQQWERRLRETSPVDTGNMQGRTTAKVSQRAGTVSVEAVVDTPYASIVARGQRPHQIGAQGQVLYNARTGFGPVRGPVQHPGTRGNSWWDDSIRDLPDLILRNWVSA